MNMLFRSVFRKHLQDFVEQKQKLGYSYKTEISEFKRIDALALKTDQKTKGITEKFARVANKKRPDLSYMFQHRRVSLLRDFSLYLHLQGIKSFVPRPPVHRKSTFVPHIYTNVEI